MISIVLLLSFFNNLYCIVVVVEINFNSIQYNETLFCQN